MSNRKSEKFSRVYEKEIGKIEKKFAALLADDKPDSLYDPCRYIISSGGKRIRPFLVLLTAKAAGGRFSNAYNAALAVELLHNFTLVHDDIMDNAPKRRGRETLHIKYDVNTAILAGDNLIAVAYKTLLKDCDHNARDIVGIFTKGIIEVCEGQSLDKEFESRRKVSIDEYKTMIIKKTAALAEMCCSIGARLGGGDKRTVDMLSSYGRNLGIAFQIQDDLLDIIGDEKEFGKSVGGDLMEGKKTFLFLRALEKAHGPDKKILNEVIRNKGVKKDRIKTIRDIYVSLGVLADTEKEIKKYTNRALKAIDKLENSEGKDNLVWLANILINRSR